MICPIRRTKFFLRNLGNFLFQAKKILNIFLKFLKYRQSFIVYYSRKLRRRSSKTVRFYAAKQLKEFYFLTFLFTRVHATSNLNFRLFFLFIIFIIYLFNIYIIYYYLYYILFIYLINLANKKRKNKKRKKILQLQEF